MNHDYDTLIEQLAANGLDIDALGLPDDAILQCADDAGRGPLDLIRDALMVQASAAAQREDSGEVFEVDPMRGVVTEIDARGKGKIRAAAGDFSFDKPSLAGGHYQPGTEVEFLASRRRSTANCISPVCACACEDDEATDLEPDDDWGY
jgi:hypothetical protein